MTEQLHTYSFCEKCGASVRASRHSETDCETIKALRADLAKATSDFAEQCELVDSMHKELASVKSALNEQSLSYAKTLTDLDMAVSDRDRMITELEAANAATEALRQFVILLRDGSADEIMDDTNHMIVFIDSNELIQSEEWDGADGDDLARNVTNALLTKLGLSTALREQAQS